MSQFLLWELEYNMEVGACRSQHILDCCYSALSRAFYCTLSFDSSLSNKSWLCDKPFSRYSRYPALYWLHHLTLALLPLSLFSHCFIHTKKVSVVLDSEQEQELNLTLHHSLAVPPGVVGVVKTGVWIHCSSHVHSFCLSCGPITLRSLPLTAHSLVLSPPLSSFLCCFLVSCCLL